MEQSKFYQIKNITEHEYTLVGCDGSVITRLIQDVDRLASAFTLQDAKDGDVLSFYTEYKGKKMFQIGIVEKYVGKLGGCYNTFKTYVGVDWDNNLQIGGYMGCDDIYPATKEQRDTLMKAMNDAGYELDVEKKELKKLSNYDKKNETV